MNQQKIKIFNARLITPYRIIPKGTVVVEAGKITAVVEGDLEVADAMEIDARGNYVSPGFIDLHVHGGGGCDFMDGSESAFLTIAETHARYGTTAMVPTTLTSEREELLRTLQLYELAHKNNTMGAAFLGMHLEGPYFALNQRGAQDPRYIRNPDPQEYLEILSKTSVIKRWSAAPELPGAMEFARHVKAYGALVALAHTDAVYDEVVKGFEHGYTLATHLYSGMNGVIRRDGFRFAGAVEAALLIDDMDVEMICDGIHLPPALLKLVYKIKGPDRIALITDAMRAAGMPPGESILGSLHNGLRVIVEDGVAKLPDRTAFAGSVVTANLLVRNMITLADVPLTDAVKMASTTPARIMGVHDRKGSLIEGKDADIVVFDDDINIQTTIINGKIIYNKGKAPQTLSAENTITHESIQ